MHYKSKIYNYFSKNSFIKILFIQYNVHHLSNSLFSVQSQNCLLVSIILTISKTKQNSVLISHHPSFLIKYYFILLPQKTSNLLSDCAELLPEILYKWNYEICNPLSLSGIFTQGDDFQGHPCCNTYQDFYFLLPNEISLHKCAAFCVSID